MRRRSLFCTASLLLSLLVSARARAAWELAPVATDEAGARSVAIATDGRLAVGDGRAVWLGDGAGPARRFDLAGASRDLAFAPDGALWIAAETGLYRLADERLELRAPAPGDLARDVRRVAAGAAGVAVVTGAGVFFSADGVRFARVEVMQGESGASAVALEDGPIAWIASERGLFRATPSDGTLRSERVALPVDLRPALDVAVHDGRVIALAPARIAERARDGRWTTAHLALPPGATPARVAFDERGVWIATDRGVVAAPSPSARFERAGDPAAVNAVALAGDRVFVATARGVWIGAALAPGQTASGPAVATSCDPPVRAVQSAALAFLRLGGDPAAAMRRGVRVRGLLPIVTLEGRKGRDDDARRAYDEAYVSGGYRHLYDADDAHSRGHEVALRLTWDLGDAAYHPESIDVSTEARRLIELRDDVLDELNQLYFDRQRALTAAAAAAPGSPDAAREQLRAAELAAGLDAWTDGWFGRVAACAAPLASPPR